MSPTSRKQLRKFILTTLIEIVLDLKQRWYEISSGRGCLTLLTAAFGKIKMTVRIKEENATRLWKLRLALLICHTSVKIVGNEEIVASWIDNAARKNYCLVL